MPDQGEKKGLKSLRTNKPLRSRGFLSAPGGQVHVNTGTPSDEADAKLHHRSRGARQITVSSDGRPEGLTEIPVIKRYTLEDK